MKKAFPILLTLLFLVPAFGGDFSILNGILSTQDVETEIVLTNGPVGQMFVFELWNDRGIFTPDPIVGVPGSDPAPELAVEFWLDAFQTVRGTMEQIIGPKDFSGTAIVESEDPAVLSGIRREPGGNVALVAAKFTE